MIVVGAGPVGLLTALRLKHAGIDTIVLESHVTPLPTERAMVYMPVVIPVVRSLGILELVQSYAFLNDEGAFWRAREGRQLAQLPLTGDTTGDFGGVLMISQKRMAFLVHTELKKYPSVEVRFGLRCAGIEDLPSSDHIKVMVHQGRKKDGDLLFHADYVLGTDGTNSSVRRIMCILSEGLT